MAENRTYPDRPIVGVGAVVVDGDRVLLVRRANEPLKGEWSIPGGAVEVGETLEAAIRRGTTWSRVAVRATTEKGTALLRKRACVC